MARKTRELKLPVQLLDRIGGEGFDDKHWRESHNLGAKRKSRKETRKDLRQLKKHKPNNLKQTGRPDSSRTQVSLKDGASKKPNNAKKTTTKAAPQPQKSNEFRAPFVSKHEEELRRRDEEDANYYAKKLGLKTLKLKDEGDGLDDILGELDYDHLSESDGNNEQFSDVEELSDVSEAGSDNGSDLDEAPTRAPSGKQDRGNSSRDGDLRVVKEADLPADDSMSDFSEFEQTERDEESEEESEEEQLTAAETMARLAALKKSKSKAAKQPISSREESNQKPDMTAEETMARLAALKKGKTVGEPHDLKIVKEDELGDDSDSSIDFSEEASNDDDELTAEETMARLAALKKNKVNNSGADTSAAQANSESSADENSSSEDDENPYIPPRRRGEVAAATSVKRPQGHVAEDSEAVQALKRGFKRALNQLAETTLPHVINQIELAFLKHPRAEASEVLTDQILELVDRPQSLQPTLYTVYASLISALYHSMGTTFAAYLVQIIVERILENTKQAHNLLNLLVECYVFQVVSSKLMYDLAKKLLADIDSAESMVPVELLLVIIRSGGSQLRSDDPLALKELIVLLQQRMQDLGGGAQLSSRMRFLVDAVVALKNNRQKPSSEMVVSLRHQLKKTIQNSGKSSQKSREAMQVGLGDILESKTRGRWWLVGASWKGESDRAPDSKSESDKVEIDLDDEFGASTPDWLELAKKQRLNTDVRRAIFVALMGAEDYLDACLRIDKLSLKNKQERDVPHVILHCLAQEPYYNPYYALVAEKQCSRHSTMKTFQFRLWDWLNSEPSGSPQLAMHYGRFFASLVQTGVMPLDVLKSADFLAGSRDVRVFLEFFFVTLYKNLAKQAEKLSKASSQRGFLHAPGAAAAGDLDGKEIVRLLSKVREPTVLRGAQIMNKSIAGSEAIQNAKDRSRVQWVAQLVNDTIDELVHPNN